jgi:predicted RNase H-like HicB family nuclease
MTGDVAQVLFFYTIGDYYLMKLKVIVREAEVGGYWAEVPAIPGCVTQGETFDELPGNIYEAVEGCLSVDLKELDLTGKDFAKQLEKKAGNCEESQEVPTFIPKKEIPPVFQCPYTETIH